jgi:hypothetical protein
MAHIRFVPALPRSDARRVTTARALLANGLSRRQLAAELSAGRWQRLGLAVVTHNGPLTGRQRWVMARIHAGPRALFTAFTAAEVYGLRGWERDTVHLLAPAGTRLRRGCPVPVRLHLHGDRPVSENRAGGVHALPDALLRAATTFGSARPACGLLAAAVQQRLVSADTLAAALDRAPRMRHRAAVLAAVGDIAQGAQALSEIDFARLCRRAGLPEPVRQGVRVEPSGRRRYLDAEWRRADGRTVIAEVDGALHLIARRWWDDQLRQNELVLADAIVLRFPSVVVRTQPEVVLGQLRRALLLA